MGLPLTTKLDKDYLERHKDLSNKSNLTKSEEIIFLTVYYRRKDIMEKINAKPYWEKKGVDISALENELKDINTIFQFGENQEKALQQKERKILSSYTLTPSSTRILNELMEKDVTNFSEEEKTFFTAFYYKYHALNSLESEFWNNSQDDLARAAHQEMEAIGGVLYLDYGSQTSEYRQIQDKLNQLFQEPQQPKFTNTAPKTEESQSNNTYGKLQQTVWNQPKESKTHFEKRDGSNSEVEEFNALFMKCRHYLFPEFFDRKKFEEEPFKFVNKDLDRFYKLFHKIVDNVPEGNVVKLGQCLEIKEDLRKIEVLSDLFERCDQRFLFAEFFDTEKFNRDPHVFSNKPLDKLYNLFHELDEKKGKYLQEGNTAMYQRIEKALLPCFKKRDELNKPLDQETEENPDKNFRPR